MEIWKTALFLFGGIGVINGCIAAMIILWKSNRKPQNIFLGMLTLMLCLRIGKSIYLKYSDGVDFLVLQIGLTAGMFIGPLFYLFLRAEFNQHKKLIKSDFVILAIASIFILSAGLIYPYRQFPEIWNSYIIIVIYIVWGGFVLYSFFRYKSSILPLFKDLPYSSMNDKRRIGIIAAILFITCTYQFALWIKGFTYLWASLIFTFVFYILLYLELFSNRKFTKQKTNISQPDQQQLDQINLAIEKDELFKDPKFRITDLAEKTGISVHEISRVINLFYENGFSHYINEKRIMEAQTLMEKRKELTLEGIGYESGFNSKSTFYASFRKLTGMTPAVYKRKLSEN